LNSQDRAVAFGFWCLAVFAIAWVRDRLVERKKSRKKAKRQTAAKSWDSVHRPLITFPAPAMGYKPQIRFLIQLIAAGFLVSQATAAQHSQARSTLCYFTDGPRAGRSLRLDLAFAFLQQGMTERSAWNPTQRDWGRVNNWHACFCGGGEKARGYPLEPLPAAVERRDLRSNAVRSQLARSAAASYELWRNSSTLSFGDSASRTS